MATPPRERWLWPPVVAYMAFIFALSSVSSVPALPGGSDKMLHTLLYGGLALVTVRAVTGGWWRRVTVAHALRTFVIVVAYGLSDEIHQLFVPNRYFELMDLVADAGGAMVAVAVMAAGARVARMRTMRAV